MISKKGDYFFSRKICSYQNEMCLMRVRSFRIYSTSFPCANIILMIKIWPWSVENLNRREIIQLLQAKELRTCPQKITKKKKYFRVKYCNASVTQYIICPSIFNDVFGGVTWLLQSQTLWMIFLFIRHTPMSEDFWR